MVTKLHAATGEKANVILFTQSAYSRKVSWLALGPTCGDPLVSRRLQDAVVSIVDEGAAAGGEAPSAGAVGSSVAAGGELAVRLFLEKSRRRGLLAPKQIEDMLELLQEDEAVAQPARKKAKSAAQPSQALYLQRQAILPAESAGGTDAEAAAATGNLEAALPLVDLEAMAQALADHLAGQGGLADEPGELDAACAPGGLDAAAAAEAASGTRPPSARRAAKKVL